MTERVDKVCDDLRDRLNMAESRLEGAKARVEAAKTAGQARIQASLEEAQAKMEVGRQHVIEAQAKMRSAVQEKRTETQGHVDDWKTRRELHKLERRADRAEDNAAWAVAVAVGAIESADVAVLQAVATRIDAETVAKGTGAAAAASG